MILRGVVTAVTGDVATVATGSDDTGAATTVTARNGTGRSPGDSVDVLFDGWRAVILATAVLPTPPDAGVLHGTYIIGDLSHLPTDAYTLTGMELDILRDASTLTWVQVDRIDGFDHSPGAFYGFGWIADESTIYGPGDVTVTLTARASAAWEWTLTLGDYASPRASTTGTVGTDWTTLTVTETLVNDEDGINYGWLRADPTSSGHPATLDIAEFGVSFTPA